MPHCNRPSTARAPLAAAVDAIGGQRRDGGKVIGPGEDVEQAGGKTREERKHDLIDEGYR